MSEMLSIEKQKEWIDIIGHDIRKCSVCGDYEHRVFLLPERIEVPLVTWKMNCYKCNEDTPVVWTQDINYDENTFSIDPYSFQDLQNRISQKYPFFKIVEKKTQGTKSFGNVCINCDAYQGDWFVWKELLEIYIEEANDMLHVEKITIELTDEERFKHAYTKLHKKLTNRTIDKVKNEKILICKDCWRERTRKNRNDTKFFNQNHL